MPLKPDVLAGKRTNVDHVDPVSCPRSYVDRQVLSLSEKSRVGNWLGSSWVALAHELLDQARHPVVIPVRNGDELRLVVQLLEGSVRLGDDERASETVGVLCMNVGMIPVNSRLVNGEVVCKAAARRDGTLGDLTRAVHVRLILEEETMEVKSGRLILQVVLHINDDPLVDAGLHGWNGPAAVDANHISLGHAVGVRPDPRDVEIVYVDAIVVGVPRGSVLVVGRTRRQREEKNERNKDGTQEGEKPSLRHHEWKRKCPSGKLQFLK